METNEEHYRRRKTRFQQLQQTQDVAKERLFILSNDKPWEVFCNGCIDGILHRRKLVFERTGSFPVLHEACISGDKNLVRCALNTVGACVLERDVCGRIALHHAVINENWKISKRLLRRRDAPLQAHVRDNSSRTALHYALEKMEVLAHHRRGRSTVELRAENKRYRQLWELADKMLEMFSGDVLEDKGAGESIQELDMRCRGDLWDACRSGDLERLEIIVRIFGCSEDQWGLSELKRTLLHEACENRQLRVIYFLLSTVKIPVQAQDSSDCTALHCAARRGYFDVCKMLLEIFPSYCGEEILENENVDDLILLQDKCGRTALHWSLAGFGDSIAKCQIGKLLATTCPEALHIYDQDGVSPLHLAIRRGDLHLVQEFVHLGASVCALSSAAQPSYGEYPEKAPWAPCGIVFQRPELRNIEKLAPVQAPDQNITNDKRSAPDWTNIQHPVETLWYWTRQANTSPYEAKNEKKSEEDKINNSEEELGCRKYGGICCRCQNFTTNDSIKPSLSASARLSPVLLALRMCALEPDNDSMVTRVDIMELLLLNGASIDDDQSALNEGLRSSLRCPQLIPLLRQYGVEKISISNITQWCITVPRRDSKQVEAVLFHLLDLEIVQNSPEFLTMLFCQKYFSLLCELWSLKAQNYSSQEVEYSSRGGAPWKCIHETLVTWSGARKQPIGVGVLDIKHLKFLCNLVGSSSDIPFEKDNLHTWDLFEYCVDSVLHQRRDINSNQDREEREQALLRCIQVLLKYWQRTESDELIKTKTTNWLEPSIIRGYFDSALVILESLYRLDSTSNLLDTVFESYSAALRLGDDQLHHHREFLILCTENLLKSKFTIGEVQTQRKVTSARSIVYICATNLSLSLVVACFDLVFPEGSNHSDVLSVMKTTRAGGKTMFQWIIYHDRCDVVLWLLQFFSSGVERGLCWAEFVAASIGNCSTKFGEIRIPVYYEHVQSHLSSDERDELLINLVVKYAIPTDSIDLFTESLKLLALDCGKQNSWAFLHSIARWNAVRIAEFCLSEQSCDQINWQTLLQENEDGTPLELCRLLGHNYLYKQMSSRIQPNFPDLKTEKTTLETDNKTEPAPDESVGYGLLRTVIELNEKTKEPLQETQRYPIIPDPWMSAVAQNQVSHLQALSLSRTPDPAVSTRVLVLAAIKAASVDALKWIVNFSTPMTKHLSDEEAVECLYAAAKHPSAVYAAMTLLLLENQLTPGRLSGDGMGIPLLHRAACFSNAPLACRIMTILLERSDCDVNVLDAFGNTAVSYAIVSGCIHNACFLIQNVKCRLEAEYEGQSSFYYVLHLAPSFSWRLILRELLVLRDRAFLHCDAEDRTCGCKGFEGGGTLCGFCEHGYSSHHIVPLPSWFRDQYDTYLNSPKKRHSRSDEDDDSDNAASQSNPTDEGLSGDEDEEIVLENTRGRLNVDVLKRITVLRYNDILQANGLTAAIEQIAEETASDNSYSPSENPLEMLEQVSTVAFNIGDQRDDRCVEFNVLNANRKDANRTKFTGAWWLRQELGMVHSSRCLCQASRLAVHPSQLVHVAVCRWLRRVAIHMQKTRDAMSGIVTESSIVALASVQPAFEHWRVVAKQSPLEAVRKPLPRTLSSLLFHWRYGQVFKAFQRWKNHRTTMEVTHHRFSSRFERVAAEMRRNRLKTLQIRQQQLESSIRGLK